MKGVIRSEREGSAGVVRGTLSVIMTENIRRHSERQRRICYSNEIKGKHAGLNDALGKRKDLVRYPAAFCR